MNMPLLKVHYSFKIKCFQAQWEIMVGIKITYNLIPLPWPSSHPHKRQLLTYAISNQDSGIVHIEMNENSEKYLIPILTTANTSLTICPLIRNYTKM